MSIDKKSSYYDAGGIETFEVIKAKLSPEQLKGYLLGNIIKYACRANYKDCYARDIEKIKVYSELLNNESFVSKTFEPSVNHGIDFTLLTNLSSGKTFEPSDTIKELAEMDEKKRKDFVKAFNDVSGEVPEYDTWYKIYKDQFKECPVCGFSVSESKTMKACDNDNCSWDTWKRYQMIFCED